MTQPGPVGGGSFAVDIAQAPKAIRELEDALEELRALQREAIALGQINPPARDQVSLDAAQVLSRKANGGASSLNEALTAGITEVTRMIQSLRAGFAAYEKGDTDAGVQFDRTS